MLYGLMVVSGIIIATWLTSRLTKKIDVWEALSFALTFGLVGARLYHVLNFWSYYSQNPLLILAIWQGGLGIFGGLLGGLLGLLLYARLRRFRPWALLDLAALGVPLAQAIGRFGNPFNQELFGLPTTLPWGIYINPENRPFPVMFFNKFHPLAIYESFGCLIIFLILVALLFYRNSHKTALDGRLFFTYIALYGILRFFLEPLRIESWTVGVVNIAQAVCVFLLVVGVLGLVKSNLRAKTANH
jgi:phosphatidylglycerol:prolipoprotein diacylglycerol transferase